MYLYHFSTFHIYSLAYSICFSLSDLLHFVWQTLGPSLHCRDSWSLQWPNFVPFNGWIMAPFLSEVVASVYTGQDEVQGPVGGGVCSTQTPTGRLSTLGPWDTFRPVVPLLAAWHLWRAGTCCRSLGLLRPEESWLGHPLSHMPEC